MSEQGNNEGAAQEGVANQADTGGGLMDVLNSLGENCQRIWSKVCQTNPAFTQPFGFVGADGTWVDLTAIKPMYQVMRATEIFGPCGTGWGFDIVKSEFIDGASMGVDKNGNSLGVEKLHYLHLKLWYHEDGKANRVQRSVESVVTTKFIALGSNGRVYCDDEATKKSRTDAIGNALSLLGFSADVYLGGFHDSRYVTGLRAKYGEPNAGESAQGGDAGNNGTPLRGQSGEQAGQQGNRQGSDGGQPASRYLQYKAKLDNTERTLEMSVKEVRDVIDKDALLTPMEKAQLLAHPRLKLAAAAEKEVDKLFL
ncbi:hypothetical protein [Burkholderia gladioli]|uniref:hypothetical protein n=1 Tax=Burkholderia gladioli TaxID=28095 RepID=UPI001640F83A|nr:hypothetical protein [Burkholderia gladioli]